MLLPLLEPFCLHYDLIAKMTNRENYNTVHIAYCLLVILFKSWKIQVKGIVPHQLWAHLVFEYVQISLLHCIGHIRVISK